MLALVDHTKAQHTPATRQQTHDTYRLHFHRNGDRHRGFPSKFPLHTAQFYLGAQNSIGQQQCNRQLLPLIHDNKKETMQVAFQKVAYDAATRAAALGPPISCSI
jgi:hypothetical protein